MKAIAQKETISISHYADNPAAVYLASLSEGSRRTMRQALDDIALLLSSGKVAADTFPWGKLRIRETQAVRSALVDKGFKHSTINKMLCALRGTLKEAWRMGQMTAEEYQQAVSVEGVKGRTLPAGRSVTKGELAALVAACESDKTPTGARDTAIIAILYAAGLRRAELVDLAMVDYDHENGSLKITGKRNKERLVWLVGGSERGDERLAGCPGSG